MAKKKTAAKKKAPAKKRTRTILDAKPKDQRTSQLAERQNKPPALTDWKRVVSLIQESIGAKIERANLMARRKTLVEEHDLAEKDNNIQRRRILADELFQLQRKVKDLAERIKACGSDVERVVCEIADGMALFTAMQEADKSIVGGDDGDDGEQLPMGFAAHPAAMARAAEPASA